MEISDRKLKEILIYLMTNSRADRNSDYALYADYINVIRPDIPVSRYYETMKNYREYGIYSFKAVERERRKIQEAAKKDNELSLLSDIQVEKYRKQEEQEYIKKYGRDEK